MTKREIEKLITENGYEFDYKEVDKNGKKILGMNLKKKGSNSKLCPCIYPDLLSENDASEEEILDLINRAFSEMMNVDDITDKLYDKEFVMNNVISCIRAISDNTDIVYFHVYEDLEEFIKLKISEQASITLTWDILNKIGLDPEEVRKAARNNSKKTAVVEPLAKKLSEMIGFPYMESEEDAYDEGQLFVLSCNNYINGASVMLFDDVLQNLAIKCGVDELTILPSSIHEVIVWTGNMEKEKFDLNEMIQDINEKEVSKFERLSDHAYHYYL